MEKIFKAKRLDNGKWVEFNLFDGVSKITWEIYDKYTICQATGINDSDGFRIFEGDEFTDGSFVRMKNGCWMSCYGDYHNYLYPIGEDLTLTGHNIHDKD